MLSSCHWKFIDDRVVTGVNLWRKEDVASFTTLLGSAAGSPFHPLSVRAMTANATEVQLAQISPTDRTCARRRGDLGRAASGGLTGAIVALEARISALEQKLADARSSVQTNLVSVQSNVGASQQQLVPTAPRISAAASAAAATSSHGRQQQRPWQRGRQAQRLDHLLGWHPLRRS